MRTPVGSVVTAVAALLWLAAPATAGTRTNLSTRQEAITVKRLLSAANGHHLSLIQSAFTASPIVQVGSRQWRGHAAVMSWWRVEIDRALHIELRSALNATGNNANAIIYRKTRGGDCAQGCNEQARWRFTGARVDRMIVTPLRLPSPPRIPTITIPPPPTAPPSPHVTPTIPS